MKVLGVTKRICECQWRDIETAPKDGSPFLVCLESEMLNSRVHIATFHPNVKIIGGRFAFDAPKAIGWMPSPEPLPEPPK